MSVHRFIEPVSAISPMSSRLAQKQSCSRLHSTFYATTLLMQIPREIAFSGRRCISSVATVGLRALKRVKCISPGSVLCTSSTFSQIVHNDCDKTTVNIPKIKRQIITSNSTCDSTFSDLTWFNIYFRNVDFIIATRHWLACSEDKKS